jgi:hypothetical protein
MDRMRVHTISDNLKAQSKPRKEIKMKRILLVGLVVASLGLLSAGFAIPVFAHGPQAGEATPTNQDAWEAMHETYEIGDWEAMAEAAEEVHGEDFGNMPCHGEGYYVPEEGTQTPDNHWNGMGGHMGGGMMGGG